MSKPEAYKITAIEHFEQVEGKPPILPEIHYWENYWPSANEDTIKDMVKRKLTKDMPDDKVEAFLGRLKIDVSCPFPG